MKEGKRFIIGGSFETIDSNNSPWIIDIPLCRSKSKDDPLISSDLEQYSVWAEEKASGEIILVVYKNYKPIDKIHWNDYKKYQCNNMPKNKEYFASLFSNYDENDGFIPFQLEYIANWVEEY